MIILVPLAWGAFKGFGKGLVLEIALIAGIVAGAYGAARLSHWASGFLHHHFQWNQKLLPFASFLLVFAVIFIGIVLLAKMIETALSITPAGILNKLGGALFGVLKWALLTSLLFFVFVPLNARLQMVSETTLDRSLLFRPMQQFSEVMVPALKDLKSMALSSID